MTRCRCYLDGVSPQILGFNSSHDVRVLGGSHAFLTTRAESTNASCALEGSVKTGTELVPMHLAAMRDGTQRSEPHFAAPQEGAGRSTATSNLPDNWLSDPN